MAIFLPTANQLVDQNTGFPTQAMYAWMRDITATVSPAAGGGIVTAVGATAPLSSSGGTTPVISHNTSGVTAATYGDSTHVAQVAINATGHVTSASNVAIAATGTVTHTAGSLTLNELVLGNGGADIKVVAATDGQVPIGKTSDGTVTLATLTAGTGITITNGAASITITSSASDYVVASNGATPPSPADDGAANFIYVAYTP